MEIRLDGICLHGNEARFYAYDNRGLGTAFNMGMGELTRMIDDLTEIRRRLGQHIAERDIAELFDEHPRQADRLLDAVNAVGLHGVADDTGAMLEECERWDGQS